MHLSFLSPPTLRHKLLLAVLGVSLLSALVAATGLFVFQTVTLRREFAEHSVALARIVAPYAAAPVAFEDQSGIDRSLDVLSGKPELIAACILSPEGHILGNVGGELPDSPAWPMPGTHRLAGWHVHATEAIKAKDEVLGQLLIITDFRPVFIASVWSFLPTLGVVMLLTLTLAGIFTMLLSRMLTRRLALLADTAQRISAGGNYSLRAPDTGRDEIGILTRSFNSMLAQLEANDSSLRSTNAALTTEITERERLQAELLEASRLAGMAEIATGVLHNVGNVLNSVNVSAGIIRDQLAASQLDKLRLSAELIQAHQHQLGEFFSKDPRGALLPGFLADLAAQLSTEQSVFAEELLRLSRNIDHIKGIVALQQGYAKSTAVVEELQGADLIEHALLINQALLAKHQVQVERDYPEEGLQLLTDRHKLLQILINLISNAAHATLGKPPERRQLRVGLHPAGEKLVHIKVSDNGVGIPAALLPRLFTQGFTTREDGHGFGLHSASLAAREIGGEITVHSDGPGLGACFTLILPVCPPTIADPAPSP